MTDLQGASDLEVRLLRYFLAVAEELHFGRAAQRLSMAQPALSQAIRKLERQLGVQLFDRTTRRVTLTAAGEVFSRDAREAVRAVAAAAQRATQAGRKQPALRLALKADYDAGLLPSLLRAYASHPESLPVELVLGGRGEQVPALHDGRADVALLTTPFSDVGLSTVELLTERRLVALASEDALVGMQELTLRDLAGRVLPDGTPAEHGVTAQAQTSYQSIGLPIPSEGPASVTEQGRLDLAQIFCLIEIGRVVLFVPASVANRHPRRDIVYREVNGLQSATLTIAWPASVYSAPVSALVRVATELAVGN